MLKAIVIIFSIVLAFIIIYDFIAHKKKKKRELAEKKLAEIGISINSIVAETNKMLDELKEVK